MWWMVIIACVTKGEQAQAERCVEALLELDEDGDGAIPRDAAPPAECDEELMMEVADRYGLGLDDCDDQDPDRFVGNTELCGDGVDQDCDGEDPEPMVWYDDRDGDDFGDASDNGTRACDQPENMVSNDSDCDDSDNGVNPNSDQVMCGPMATDSDCDGVVDCLLSEGLSSATFIALDDGAGGAVAAEDGLAVIGGDNAAWTLESYSGRALSAESLNPGFGEGEEAGADVAVLGGVVMVGAPFYSADRTYQGRIALSRNGQEVAWIEGASDDNHVGRSLSSGGGSLAVSLNLEPYRWHLYLVSQDLLPSDGTSESLTSIEESTVISGLISYEDEDTPPSVSITSAGGEALVAVGQFDYREDLSNGYVELFRGNEWFLQVTPDHDPRAFGTSVLLMDFDGSGEIDLLVGDPDTEEVYLFLEVPGSTGDLSTSDADLTFSGTSQTGLSLANAGDINGDGQDDLLVGAEDTVYLFLGGELSYGWEPYATLEGEPGSDLGADLAGTDLDQDGYSDLILGAPGDGGVYVLWGGPP